jgi:hypothetical protein
MPRFCQTLHCSTNAANCGLQSASLGQQTAYSVPLAIPALDDNICLVRPTTLLDAVHRDQIHDKVEQDMSR